MDSVEEYKKLLRRQIDHEIPRAMDETLAKHAYLMQHKKNLELELERLMQQKEPKEILDLPLVAWEKIIANCANPIREVMRLCLASSKLEQVVTQGVWRDKVKLIGVNVFALLLQNVYLVREDITNCLKTGNRLVETLAVTSWRHFDEQELNDTVRYITSEVELENFWAEVTKSGFPWRQFLGKEISIWPRGGVTSPQFWNRVAEFLEIYGKFISRIEIRQDCEVEKKVAIKREWFPQLQTFHFQICQGVGDNERASSVQIKTIFGETFNESLLYVSANARYIGIEPVSKMFYEIADRCGAGMFDERVCRGNLQCLTELRMHIYPKYDNVNTDKFLQFQGIDMKKMRKISLTTSCNLTGIMVLLSRFENLSHLNLSLFPANRFTITEEQFRWPENFTIPGLRTLRFSLETGVVRILRTSLNFLLPISNLATVFPHLRRLGMKVSTTKQRLATFMKQALDADGVPPRHIVDVYKLYSEGDSLAGSNIWSLMSELHTFAIQTLLTEDEGGQLYTVKPWLLERYTRQRNGVIQFQNSLRILMRDQLYE